MRHIPLIAAVLAAAVLAPIAASADRMWVGFHDDPDPALRRGSAEPRWTTATATNNASIVRSLVTWADVAPTKPSNAADPFDPAYRFDDLDEFVRNAQKNNAEVLLTLWGTPKWANGNKGRNYLPTSMTDFQNFAKAVATRYSGRTAGYPFVRFYGIWNESNLGLFLSPQFNSKGQIVSPAAYAKLAAAGYAGIKAGNSKALVAIGETSSSGRDKKKAGASDAVAPGTFAQMVAKANKKLKFDAWAQHPYPVPVNQTPTQKVKWPNVALTSLPQFETSLDTLVRAQEHPGLDHRVRQRDEAGRAEGRHRGAAGGVHPPGDRHREEGQARPDVHLVRAAGLGGQPLAERDLPEQRQREAGAAEVGGSSEAAQPGERQAQHQGRNQEPVRHRLPPHVLRQQPDRREGRRRPRGRRSAASSSPSPSPRRRSRSTARRVPSSPD